MALGGLAAGESIESEPHDDGVVGEGPDGGSDGAWLEVEDHGVVVVGGVHSF